MAKAKLSKSFELFGEHLLPLRNVKEVRGEVESVLLGTGQGESWAQLKSEVSDVSGLSDKISVQPSFFLVLGLRFSS